MSEERNPRDREMSDGFKRQRRNLLIASIFVAIYFSSGAKIEKLNLLGTTIKIDNPAIANYSITLIFCYFIIRFWQYYKEEFFVKDSYIKLRDYTYSWERSYLRHIAAKRIKKFDQFDFTTMFPRGSRASDSTMPQKKDIKVSLFTKTAYIYAYFGNQRNDEKSYNIFHNNMNESKHWKIFQETSDNQLAVYETAIDYSVIKFYSMRLWGILLYTINESYFTDYQLPVLFAFLATVLAIMI